MHCFHRWHFGNRTIDGKFVPQAGGAYDESVGAIAMPTVVTKLHAIGSFIVQRGSVAVKVDDLDNTGRTPAAIAIKTDDSV